MSIKIKRQRGTVEFCEDMSKQADWERATEELRLAQEKPSVTLNNPDLQAKAKAVTDTEVAMAENLLVFELEALSRKKWQEFEASHPPRPGSDEDEVLRVNVSSFFDAVLMFTDTDSAEKHPTIVKVTRKRSGRAVPFDPAVDWLPLADEMTDGQWQQFCFKLILLNRGNAGVPFSRAASQLMKPSDAS